jgi:hypothetical protein
VSGRRRCAFPLLVAVFAAPAAADLPDAPVSTPWGEIPRPVVEPLRPDERLDIPFGPPDSLALPPPPRPPLPDVFPFGEDERFEFSIDYGIINAGHATMEICGVRRVGGRPCFDIRTEAKSNRFFSRFYKVWDRAQSFLDTQSLLPMRFEKHLREGGYRKDDVIKFDREYHFARYDDGEEVAIHPFAQDELSAFYYARTLPLVVGQDLFIDSHANHKNYPLKVIVHGRETVEVSAGTFDCFAIEPVIREGGIFTAKGRLTIWVSADERRIPVKMRTKVVVGSITASLQEYRLGERAVRGAQRAPARR